MGSSSATATRIYFGIDTVIPCVLIVHEFVSSVLTHAFPNRMRGELWIPLQRTSDGECVLTVRDIGIGMPAGFDPRMTRSLGLRLVHDLTMSPTGAS
jgi:two-component sensor histidine kinase